MKNINAGRIARDVPMVVSLALTLAVGGQGVAADLPLDGRTALALGMGGALLFDSLWLAGSVALPDALVVRGGKLALSVSAMVAGIAASIWSLAHYGHGPLFLAPVFAVLLTVGIELNKHVTPSAETITDLRLQAAAARDLKARSRAAERLSKGERDRASVDRTVVAEKLTDEMLDADRAEAARTMALLAAQSKLAGKLDKADKKHGAGAERFTELRGTTKLPELPAAAPAIPVAPQLPAAPVTAVTQPLSQLSTATFDTFDGDTLDDGYDFIKSVLAEAESNVATDPTLKLLTGVQVAEIRKVSPGTVRSWVNRGKLSVADRDDAGRALYRADDVARMH